LINFLADAALIIGLANGFDSQQPIVNEMDEPLITQKSATSSFYHLAPAKSIPLDTIWKVLPDSSR
jgi:hypothetical protein